MMIWLKNAIDRFRDEERATLSVEAVIVLPLLLFAYGGMLVFWDAYKTDNVTQKAAYTISDMISREIVPVNQAYFDGLHTMFEFLTYQKYDTRIRVTVVKSQLAENGVDSELVLSWSEASAGWAEVTDIVQIEEKIPPVAIGDEAIVVETFVKYTPVLDMWMDERNLYQVVVTRPRFAPQIKWEDPADGGAA